MQEAIKEIAELWSSPSDTPNYTQIFKILEGKLEKEKMKLIEAFFYGATYEGDKKHIIGRAAYDYYDRYYNQDK